MKFYHKIFTNNPELSIKLDNQEPLVEYVKELFNRLADAQNIEELHDVKCSILRDFRDIYIFDLEDAEFPEPVGHFDSEEEKCDFRKKKILVQDMVRYLGEVFKKYHTLIYEKNGMLPSLIERGLAVNLQNRLLYKSLCRLPDEVNLKKTCDAEEEAYIDAFLHHTYDFRFYAKESHVMEKMYTLFVREGALEASAENEMILAGVGRNNKRKLTRTLGTLLKTDFAKEEILPEYLELMEDIFGRLNIRNAIMHGRGETFDNLNIGFVAIMFQLLWDIAECGIFKE